MHSYFLEIPFLLLKRSIKKVSNSAKVASKGVTEAFMKLN